MIYIYRWNNISLMKVYNRSLNYIQIFILAIEHNKVVSVPEQHKYAHFLLLWHINWVKKLK